MRADRLLTLLLLLQSTGRMTAGELAAHLEVSERTVYRDVDALLAAGVPLYAESGPGGGYRLVQGYRTRLTGMTRHEAQALTLAGLPGPAADLGLGSVAASAQLKLVAALPPDLAAHARRVSSRFHLDTATWYRTPDEAPHLTTIAEATWSERLVEMRYRRWREPREVERVVAPLGLVLKSGAWYVVALVGERISTFRVSEVRSARLGDRFDRPVGFDLARHWQTAVAGFERRQQFQGEAVVLASPRGHELLTQHSSQVVASAASTTATPVDEPADWLRVVLPIETVEHAALELLRFGAEIEVIEPAALRDRIAEIAKTLVDRYSAVSAR